MQEYVISFFAFIIITFFLSIGVIFTGKQLNASCGKKGGDDDECSVCICEDENA